MQTNLNKNTNFFDLINQLIENQGIKNVNIFATKHLNYKSPEKINRLKDSSKKPSYTILSDIKTYFPDVNMNWLLTGEGEMLIANQNELIGNSEENNDPKYLRLEIKGLKGEIKIQEKLIITQEKTISTKEELIKKLNVQIKSLGGDAQESA